MSLQSFTFSSETPDTGDAFGAYHDLYSVGSDVARLDGAFHARVRAYRFARMIVYDRYLHGLVHARGPVRVRRDGFDHIALHLLLSGSLSGGAPGSERAVAPREILVCDTTRPQASRAVAAHVISVAVAREQIEAQVPEIRAFHGTVLPEAAGGLLADLVVSLVKRAPTMLPGTAERAARGVAEFLAAALCGYLPATEAESATEQLALMRRERAEAFLDARLADPKLDADLIAAGTGVSRSVLYRSFSSDGGVAHVIRARRLERLRALLRRGNEARSVSALAYACGFSSESHCSRAFRDAYGVPPGQFRAEMQRARAIRFEEHERQPTLRTWLCELY